MVQQGAQPDQLPSQLPPALSNLDQLKVLLDALPDYHADDEQPSYVLAIPCRPILIALSSSAILNPSAWPNINWPSLMNEVAGDGGGPFCPEVPRL